MRRLGWMAVSIVVIFSAPVSAQPVPGFERPGLTGIVRAMASFDDGSGPALYAAGEVSMADLLTTRLIARWDGNAWSTVGALGNDSNPATVSALAVHDDGSGAALYACGFFLEIGGLPIEKVARWDGATWSAVGDGPVNCTSFAVYDDGDGPVLYAGTLTGDLLRWDGAAWTTLLTMNGGRISALEVFDDGNGERPSLFIGGDFVSVGALPLFGLARWDGAALFSLATASGIGLDDTATTLAVYDDGDGEKLYIGGDFTMAGGEPAVDLVAWDGTDWDRSVSDPPGSQVIDLFTDTSTVPPRLILSAPPSFDGAVPKDTTWEWDGTAFTPVATAGANGLAGISGALDDSPLTFALHDEGDGPRLYAGGSFGSDGLSFTTGIARWDLDRWSPMSAGGNGLENTSWIATAGIYDLDGQPRLYAGGFYRGLGAVGAARLAIFDGVRWTAPRDPAGEPQGAIDSMEVFEVDGRQQLVAAGGFFNRQQAPSFSSFGAWDGVAWSPLPGGQSFDSTTAFVLDLKAGDIGFGPHLFMAGGFATIDGVAMNNLAAWDGAGFQPLVGRSEVGAQATVRDLEIFDDGGGPDLYIAGDFTSIGGSPIAHFARWDGVEFSAVGVDAFTGGEVFALAIFDSGSGPDLYAGGEFTHIGALEVNGIARWDGQSWAALAGAEVGVLGAGSSTAVRLLTPLDAGDGRKLYVSGVFERAGGLVGANFARWDGDGWSRPPGADADGFVGSERFSSMVEFQDAEGLSLFGGGNFRDLFGVKSNGVGQYRARSLIFADDFESGDASAWVVVP